jgi:CBS domain-containing protein
MLWRRKKTAENKYKKTKRHINNSVEDSLREGSGQNPSLLVSDVYKLHGNTSVSINSDASVGEIIASFVRNPSLGGIFLVDSQLRYVGLITRIDLMRWAHIKLTGGKGRHEINVSEFFRIADARKAEELVGYNTHLLSVKEDDTLQAALDKMLDYEHDVIPVLDNENRIIGDLGLSEVLWSGSAYGRRASRME